MTARAGEVAWVLAHLDDLDADFARYFRCDLYDLSGPRLFTRAQRVSVYGGVIAYRLAQQSEPVPPEGDDDLPPVPQGARQVPITDLPDLIEG